ncbi:MAG: pancreas/duodenum homeobox protein 1 [Desulfobulbaceae bacterium]|nr:pancreas/duodenum homeobox protein 1 [Desulfobulbaceae bacterium]
MADLHDIFTDDALQKLFPASRANDFFDALFGDASEGAYDIALKFNGYRSEDKELHFALDLIQRPGKCLACNLTYGLPEVFSRHPVINVKGLVADINKLLEGQLNCKQWSLTNTKSVSSALHFIPLVIQVE